VNIDEMTIGCGAETLTVSQVQLEGKNPMTLRELLNGRPAYFQRDAILASAR
jgi:methionyl-tRNA formyltransferase